MRGRAVLVLLWMVTGVGCRRESPDEPLCASTPAGCPSRGQDVFEQYVAPLVEGTCAKCHSNPSDPNDAPDFLDVVPGDAYESLVSRKDFVSCDVENSLLLQKGLEPDHPGGDLTVSQRGTVLGWLTIEAKDRFGGACKSAPPPSEPSEAPAGAVPLTGLEALAQLGDCMTLDDWLASGMPAIARQTATHNQEQVPCHACHSVGTGSNWMPDPDAEGAGKTIPAAFEAMRRVYPIFNLVRWTVSDEDGSFEDIVPSNRWRDKGKDPDHPPFELDQQSREALEQWFELTYARWKAGSCAP